MFSDLIQGQQMKDAYISLAYIVHSISIINTALQT